MGGVGCRFRFCLGVGGCWWGECGAISLSGNPDHQVGRGTDGLTFPPLPKNEPCRLQMREAFFEISVSRKRAQFAVAALSGHGLDDIGGVLRPLGRSSTGRSRRILSRALGRSSARTFQARDHAPHFILIVHRVLRTCEAVSGLPTSIAMCLERGNLRLRCRPCRPGGPEGLLRWQRRSILYQSLMRSSKPA